LIKVRNRFKKKQSEKAIRKAALEEEQLNADLKIKIKLLEEEYEALRIKLGCHSNE
jgi:hypothetical protein